MFGRSCKLLYLKEIGYGWTNVEILNRSGVGRKVVPHKAKVRKPVRRRRAEDQIVVAGKRSLADRDREKFDTGIERSETLPAGDLIINYGAFALEQ